MLIKKVSALLGVVGLIVATVQHIAGLNELLATHFWLILFVAWALAVGALTPKHRKSAKLKSEPTSMVRILVNCLSHWKFVIMITLVALALAIAHYYEQHRTNKNPNIKPYRRITIGTTLRGSSPFWLGEAEAASLDSIHLLQFGLQKERSIFTEKISREGLRYFSLPHEVDEQIGEFSVWKAVTEYLKEDCSEYVRWKKPRAALQRFAQANDRVHLIKYFNTDSLLTSLAVRRPAKAAQLIPIPEEWDELRAGRPVDYALIQGWARNCIGVPDPVFRFLIDNTSDRKATLFAIRYHILKTEHVMAAGPTPEVLIPGTPIVQSIDASWRSDELVAYIPTKFDEVLRYLDLKNADLKKNTLQIPPPLQRDIDHPVIIPEGSSALVNLQLYLECWDGISTSGETLLMSIELVTNRGSVRTEEFLLRALPYCGP